MGILSRYVEFCGDCVSRTTMPFSGKQHLKQNVNLPGYTLAPAAPTPSYKPQITALQADSSHFSGVVIKISLNPLQAQNEPKIIRWLYGYK